MYFGDGDDPAVAGEADVGPREPPTTATSAVAYRSTSPSPPSTLPLVQQSLTSSDILRPRDGKERARLDASAIRKEFKPREEALVDEMTHNVTTPDAMIAFPPLHAQTLVAEPESVVASAKSKEEYSIVPPPPPPKVDRGKRSSKRSSRARSRSRSASPPVGVGKSASRPSAVSIASSECVDFPQLGATGKESRHVRFDRGTSFASEIDTDTATAPLAGDDGTAASATSPGGAGNAQQQLRRSMLEETQLARRLSQASMNVDHVVRSFRDAAQSARLSSYLEVMKTSTNANANNILIKRVKSMGDEISVAANQLAASDATHSMHSVSAASMSSSMHSNGAMGGGGGGGGSMSPAPPQGAMFGDETIGGTGDPRRHPWQ